MDVTIRFLLNTMGVIVLTVVANVLLFLGIFLINPAFSEKSGKYGLNILIASFLQIFLFLLPIVLLDLTILHAIFYITIPVTFLLGIISLSFGKRRLDAME